jgi:hypothetical protein
VVSTLATLVTNWYTCHRYNAVKFDSEVQTVVATLTSNAKTFGQQVRDCGATARPPVICCAQCALTSAVAHCAAASHCASLPRRRMLRRCGGVECDAQVEYCVSAPRPQVNAAKQNRQGTFTSAGIDRCRALLAKADKSAPRVIILVTDGRPTL